jgi:hypothetical protein
MESKEHDFRGFVWPILLVSLPSYSVSSMFVAGFEVLTAVVMKSTIFWDITPCSPLKVNQRFGGIYRSAFKLVSCSAYS